MFYFYPLAGKMIQFDESYFSNGLKLETTNQQTFYGEKD